MTEFLWFVGGAVAYQVLSRLLRVSQLYMLFQEIHAHALMMLDAASQDLDTAVDLKLEMMEEASLEQGQIELINSEDSRAVESWRATAILKMQMLIPGIFKSAIKYNNWDEMKKYLRSILKS